MKRLLGLYVVPTLVILLWTTLPLMRGEETLYLRDVFNTHLPKKWMQAEAMKEGRLPLVDPLRDGGQPHLGNPNAVPLYPDNLLYLVAHPIWALNAHFWLHLLIAPWSFFWFGRVWGLSRRAAWAGGVCYAVSGFFLSNLNLYNLVAGVSLTPALAAATIELSRRERPGGRMAAAGVLWCLVALGGDPMTAAVALVVALTAAAARLGVAAIRWVRTATAFALGTLLAAPQLVEFARILPLSFRGYQRYSLEAAMAASWNPATVVEWLVPLIFGPPDLGFWGRQIHGGDLPLYFSLYPGLLALVLVLAAGRPRSRAAWWAWGAAAGGIFLALGKFNPVVGWLLSLPGGDVLRLPVKFWLPVALGGALLCALGFERVLAAGTGRVTAGALALGAPLAGLWIFFALAPEASRGALAGWAGAGFTGAFAEQQRLRVAGLCLLSLALLACFALIARVARRWPAGAGAALLVAHQLAQLFLLRPLLATDRVEPYREPPALLAAVPPGSVVVHGKSDDLFGPTPIPVREYPDARLRWLQRQIFRELYPVAGALWNRRYDFTLSPEGLDSFLTRAATQAIESLPDAGRIRFLAASGVDLLLLGRELDHEARPLADLVHRSPGVGGEIFVYRIGSPAPAVQFVGRVVRAPHLNAALSWMTAPDFDPSTMVVLPEGGPALAEAGGSVRILVDSPERLEVEVEARGPGALVVQRAWLPLWQARIDGKPRPVVAANLHRLGVEVPTGIHRVSLRIDRRPLALAGLASLAGLLALALGCLRERPWKGRG